MTVYVVTLCKDAGIIAGVFSSNDKASDYVTKYPYNTYIITERVVDEA